MIRLERMMVLPLAALAACGTKLTTPTSAPVPVALQGGEIAVLKPTTEQIVYGNMAAVAIRQSRFHTQAKRVGLYQGEDPRAPLYPIVKTILEQNAFQEIHQGQTKVACTMPQRAGLRGTGARAPTCGLDRVDVLLQVTSVQIMRDSGYVGGYITQVFKDEDRPKTFAFCFIAVWRQGDWDDVHNSLVKEPRDCAADRKH
jgi:hypothetical protein